MSVTPDFIGQVYKDTNTGNIWRANSTTPGDFALELQNMQCTWETTDQKFGEKIGFMCFGDLPGITQMNFLGYASIAGFDLESMEALTTIAFPNLVSIDPTEDQYGSLYITYNSNIEEILIPNLSVVGGDISIIQNDSLAEVNLSSITSVAGACSISTNLALTSGLNLPLLVSVGLTFDCSGNNMSVLSIPSLLTVGRDFNSSGNVIPNLSVPSLVSIVRDCIVGSDNVVQTVASFPNLQTVGRDLYCTGSQLTTISFPSLTTVTRDLVMSTNSSCTSLTFAALTSAGSLEFNNSGYVTLSFPSLTALGGNINCSVCALNAASVNGILATLVAIPTYGAGKTVNLSGGTNAAPSGQGIADKATLQGRGATVLTN